MRVIKDNCHRYITNKDNTFVTIMVARFDYDPEDYFFYKVNKTLDRKDIITPGQLLHIDIVFIDKILYPFSVDDFRGYFNLIRMLNKTTNSLQRALLNLTLFYCGHLKVVRTISSDHESVFKSYSLFLAGHGANYRTRIPRGR